MRQAKSKDQSKEDSSPSNEEDTNTSTQGS